MAEPTQAVTKYKEMQGFMDKLKGDIAQALPKHLTADRVSRVALTLFRVNPKLLECTPASLVSGILLSSQMGLELGPLGHAYLVPFKKNDKQGRYIETVAQYIIGYKGYLKLIRQSAQVTNIEVRPVYENDEFNIAFGLERTLKYVPYFMLNKTEPGALKGVYMCVWYKDGANFYDYMPKGEIEFHRNISKAGGSTFWTDFYEEMAMKTIVRKNVKWLPISIEDQNIIQNDGSVHATIEADIASAPCEDISGFLDNPASERQGAIEAARTDIVENGKITEETKTKILDELKRLSETLDPKDQELARSSLIHKFSKAEDGTPLMIGEILGGHCSDSRAQVLLANLKKQKVPAKKKEAEKPGPAVPAAGGEPLNLTPPPQKPADLTVSDIENMTDDQKSIMQTIKDTFDESTKIRLRVYGPATIETMFNQFGGVENDIRAAAGLGPLPAKEAPPKDWAAFYAMMSPDQQKDSDRLQMTDQAKYDLAASPVINFYGWKFMSATKSFPKK